MHMCKWKQKQGKINQNFIRILEEIKHVILGGLTKTDMTIKEGFSTKWKSVSN